MELGVELELDNIGCLCKKLAMFVPLSFCVCCNILYHSSELLTNGPINVLQASVVGGGTLDIVMVSSYIW